MKICQKYIWLDENFAQSFHFQKHWSKNKNGRSWNNYGSSHESRSVKTTNPRLLEKIFNLIKTWKVDSGNVKCFANRSNPHFALVFVRLRFNSQHNSQPISEHLRSSDCNHFHRGFCKPFQMSTHRLLCIEIQWLNQSFLNRGQYKTVVRNHDCPLDP